MTVIYILQIYFMYPTHRAVIGKSVFFREKYFFSLGYIKKNFLTIYEIYAYFTNTTEKLVSNIKETKHTLRGKVKGNFYKES